MINSGEFSPILDERKQAYPSDLEYLPFPKFHEDYLPDSVYVHFHFSPHRTAEQFDEGRQLLKSTDIFVPEAECWSEQTQSDFTAISKGNQKRFNKLSEAQAVHDNTGYTRAIYESLLGTYKPVVLIDSDESMPHTKLGDLRKKYAKSIRPDVEGTLAGFADTLADIAHVTYQRDLIMGERLGPKVTEMVAQHPRLVSKEQVNVLVVLGFTHTQLYEALIKSPAFRDRITSSFWNDKASVDIESKITDTYKNGRVPTRDDLTEFMITYALGSTSVPAIDRRPLYDFNNPYVRNRDVHNYAGDLMIQMVKGLGDEGLGISHRILRKTITFEDKIVLSELAKAAHAEAAATRE